VQVATKLVKLFMTLACGRQLRWILIAAFTTTECAQAKLIDITLGQLVKDSAFIAYGHSESTGNIVVFEPLSRLKGSPTRFSGRLEICNTPQDSESYDLRQIHGNYIFFAVQDDKCLRPVHGISSIIVVENNMARTAAISDQPRLSRLASLLHRVRALVKQQPQ
jgi:hypothetical protein